MAARHVTYNAATRNVCRIHRTDSSCSPPHSVLSHHSILVQRSGRLVHVIEGVRQEVVVAHPERKGVRHKASTYVQYVVAFLCNHSAPPPSFITAPPKERGNLLAIFFRHVLWRLGLDLARLGQPVLDDNGRFVEGFTPWFLAASPSMLQMAEASFHLVTDSPQSLYFNFELRFAIQCYVACQRYGSTLEVVEAKLQAPVHLSSSTNKG